MKVSVRRLSQPEVTHFTQTGALGVKAGKLVCHNVARTRQKRDSSPLAAATCGDAMGGGGRVRLKGNLTVGVASALFLQVKP